MSNKTQIQQQSKQQTSQNIMSDNIIHNIKEYKPDSPLFSDFESVESRSINDGDSNSEVLNNTINESDNNENEELIFDPYNPNNKEITDYTIQSILSKYGVPGLVHNINLYKRAFVHKSYVKQPEIYNETNGITIAENVNNCMSLKSKSNERLEFLGDGVLECVTKYYLYRRFPKANEGFMTEKKIALVKNEHIGKLAYEMGLHNWYIISRNAEEKNTRTNLKKLGCLFEAFIGALFLDFNKISIHDEDKWFDNVFVTGPGFQIAQIFIENVFEKHVNWMKLIKDDDNYKNIFQMKVQKTFKTTPIYLLIEQTEEEGYHMGVYLALNTPVQDIKHENAEKINGKIKFSYLQKQIEENGSVFVMFSDSKHKIKKKAEQTACEIALHNIIEDVEIDIQGVGVSEGVSLVNKTE
jgi:dsRNA-specific ribonuclease